MLWIVQYDGGSSKYGVQCYQAKGGRWSNDSMLPGDVASIVADYLADPLKPWYWVEEREKDLGKVVSVLVCHWNYIYAPPLDEAKRDEKEYQHA